ncbi:MAG TPA: hypothetical protein VL947_02580, partial [Cytophagales bacterium]|nr:hypothetical protein [Cytophagales bacterium]
MKSTITIQMRIAYISTLISLFFQYTAFSQLNFKQQKAINNYITAVNALSDETYKAINCLYKYSDGMKKKGNHNMMLPSLSCADQVPPYYLNNALQESNVLPAATAASLNTDLKIIFDRYEDLINSCRTLEAYTRLRDYDTDQFAKAKQLIESVQTTVIMLKKEVANFEHQISKQALALQGPPKNIKVAQARTFVYQTVQDEKVLLDLFFMNFSPENFSAQFPIDALQEHVNKLDIKLSSFKYANTMPYPANYQFNRYVETLKKDMQVMKRELINGYTAKEQNDDLYANEALVSLINYYNNLVSTQNSFADAVRQQ